MYDTVGPRILKVHDVVRNNYIVGHDLRCRMLPSYVMTSVLTYEVLGFLNHIACDIVSFLYHVVCDIPCDIAYDLYFASKSGV